MDFFILGSAVPGFSGAPKIARNEGKRVERGHRALKLSNPYLN